MKLEYIYSKVYFRNLNKHSSTNRTWEEVKNIGKNFEKKYTEEINRIIKIIPKITGKPWREKQTKVYFIDWLGPSFSHPLTLKVRDDLLLMLVILTHELLHDFYLQDKDIEKVEIKINKQVEKVFEELKIDAGDQINTLQNYHNKRFKK
ncbi:MAG: hypothetical protein WCW56_00990 [Candidatus Paceibacterota bacterium]|jgi:hypothetical protein